MRLKGMRQLFLALLSVATVLLLIKYTLLQKSVNTKGSYVSSPIREFGFERHLRNKWIVTSSVHTLNVTNIRGWTVLVYGTDNNRCRSPDCIFLDDELPKYEELLPGAFSRELTAYLIAISHGATFVLTVTEWQDQMSGILNKFVYGETASGIVALTNKSVVDARTIFSTKKSIYFNDAELSSPPHYTFFDYILQDNIHPLIQRVVSPYHQDSSQTKGTQLDKFIHLPPVFIPVDTFTSLDFEMTLFYHDAFWAFVLKHLPFGDMIAQRLMWEVEGLLMAILGSNAQSFRHLDTFHPLTTSTSKYISQLQLIKKFTCERSLNILACLDKLLQLLKEKGLISIRDEETAKSWIFHLESVGYKYPRRSVRSKQKINRIETTRGIFAPPRAKPQNQNVALIHLKMFCPKRKLQQPKKVITDIALIISFNSASLYDNIPLLEAMYKPYFQQIIYCGPKIENFRLYAHNFSSGHYIFIEALKRGWHYMFECTVQAMKMNLDVKGYLQIGDDTLLNSWNLEDLPRDRIWLHMGIRWENVSQERLAPHWIWWKNGKRGLNNLLNEILAEKEYHQQNDFEFRFLKNFMNSSQNGTKYYIQGCDFMYVPEKLKVDYIKVTNLLIKHQVMLELGYPNVALGLQSWQEIYFVEDGSLWRTRHQNKDKYRTDMVFLHPFKLKKELAMKRGIRLFCDVYLGEHPRMHLDHAK